jgi:hypothetical protein
LNSQKSVRNHQILDFFAQDPDFRQTTETHTIKIANPPVNMPPKPELTSDQRLQVVSQFLLLVKYGSESLKLKRGTHTSVANNFDVKPQTVEHFGQGLAKTTRIHPSMPSVQVLSRRTVVGTRSMTVMKYERLFCSYLRTGREHYGSWRQLFVFL